MRDWKWVVGILTRSAPYWFIVGATIVEFFFVFTPGSIIIGDFAPSSPYYIIHGEGQSLNPVYMGGAYNLDLSHLPLDSGIAVLSSLVSPAISYDFVFIAIQTLAGFSLVWFLKSEPTGNKFGPLEYTIGGFIYAFNPWVYSNVILGGHVLSTGLAYALTPLLLLSEIRLFRVLNVARLVSFALLIAVVSAASNYWLLFVGFLLLLFLLPENGSASSHGIKKFARRVGLLFAGISVGILVSLYWVLPFASVVLAGTNVQLNPISGEFISQVSQYGTLLNTIRLNGYWGFAYSFGIYETSSPLLNSIYLISSFVFPALACGPLFWKRHFAWREGSNLWLVSLCAVPISLLLASGNLILGWIYDSAAQSIPVLDNVSLFLAPLVFVYAISSPLTIQKIVVPNSIPPAKPVTSRQPGFSQRAYRRVRRKLSKPTTRRVILAAAIGAVLVANWPAWTGDFAGAYTSLDQPAAYSSAYTWLASQSDGLRSLWLPSTGPYVDLDWAGRSSSSLVADPVRFETESPILNPPIGSIDSTTTTQFIAMVQQLLWSNATTNIGIFLSEAAVKFLVIRTDVVPTDFPERLLESSFRQKDLELVWNNSPVWIFRNEQPVSMFQVDKSVAIVYGDFATTNALPWLGVNLSDTAVVYPEQLSYESRVEAILDNQSVIILPSPDFLDFVASLIPPQFWLNTLNLAGQDWSYDPTAGYQYDQFLYQGAVTSTGVTPVEASISAGEGGNTTILIQYLGGTANYNVTIDGVVPQVEYATYPPGAFDWVEYDVRLAPGAHSLNITPTGPGFHAVSSIISVPDSALNTTLQLINSVRNASKIAMVVPGGSLYPTTGSSVVNLYAIGGAQPFMYGLNLGPSGLGLAGSGGVLLASGAGYKLGVLANTSSASLPASFTIYTWANQNGSLISGPSTATKISSTVLDWSIINFTLDANDYRFQVSGHNLTLAAVALIPRSWRLVPTTQIVEFGGQSPLVGLLSQDFATGRFQLTISIANAAAIGLSYGFSSFWSAFANSDSAPLTVLGGFALGIVLSGNLNGSLDFEFLFNPQLFAVDGWHASVVTLGVLLIGVLFEASGMGAATYRRFRKLVHPRV